jgi:hypothetical protein
MARAGEISTLITSSSLVLTVLSDISYIPVAFNGPEFTVLFGNPFGNVVSVSSPARPTGDSPRLEGRSLRELAGGQLPGERHNHNQLRQQWRAGGFDLGDDAAWLRWPWLRVLATQGVARLN